MALVMSDPKTLALGIEYRGTAFNGWQVQPDHPSVQAALEAALSQFADHPISVICAGRTDTGVHATHQVVSFTSVARRPSAGWIRGVNAILPESVAVRWMREVDEKFHARFSARSRTYEYWIWNDPVRSPLFEGSAGWVFRASECQAKTPVRTISELKIVRRGALVGVRITANAFLQHMVRNIVGALIYVGTGRERPEWIAEVLAAKSRDAAAPTFSPVGLYLTGVGYPEHPHLPQLSSGPFGKVF